MVTVGLPLLLRTVCGAAIAVAAQMARPATSPGSMVDQKARYDGVKERGEGEEEDHEGRGSRTSANE